MTDLTIWFGIWDDYVEKLEDEDEAEEFRFSTKEYVAQSFGLSPNEDTDLTTTSVHPLILNFAGIAKKIRDTYDVGTLIKLFFGRRCFDDRTDNY